MIEIYFQQIRSTCIFIHLDPSNSDKISFLPILQAGTLSQTSPNFHLAFTKVVTNSSLRFYLDSLPKRIHTQQLAASHSTPSKRVIERRDPSGKLEPPNQTYSCLRIAFWSDLNMEINSDRTFQPRVPDFNYNPGRLHRCAVSVASCK